MFDFNRKKNTRFIVTLIVIILVVAMVLSLGIASIVSGV